MHAHRALRPFLTILLLVLAGLLAGGCASARRAKLVDAGLTAPTMEEALQAAARAMDRDFDNVMINRATGEVVADPLLVDFGETELETVGKLAEQPLEVTQALGSIRRIPYIMVIREHDGYGFKIQVEREVEELEAGYVPYDTPYDFHEHSSMPINPGAGGGVAPARAVWVPQGNDLEFQERLRRALQAELQ
jgi:hypothetical protein